jgi:two-component system phosphate regulon sensor histidine kinase PhoR
MFKNQTPQELSLSLASIVSILTVVLVRVIAFVGTIEFPQSNYLLLFLVAFAVTYASTFYLLRYYLFRRIKLIYKVIHQQKLTPDFKAEAINMHQNLLDDVEQEVDRWADKNRQELEDQEILANYRRRFIGDVSHELKTPIFNIQGFIHTLLDGAMNDPNVNFHYLKRAARNADRLEQIVLDLETINKLESGQMVLDLQEFDIHELTDEVFADLERRAQEKHIKLTFKEGANQHYKVLADKESIRQVLINLIHNSIKYGTNGGTSKVSFYDMESFLLVEVSDNGIGIDEEAARHVFDRFYRVDKSRSRDAGGTGLGLSIVKHIVEAHKQTINVRSSLGSGSTFGFTVEKAT